VGNILGFSGQEVWKNGALLTYERALDKYAVLIGGEFSFLKTHIKQKTLQLLPQGSKLF